MGCAIVECLSLPVIEHIHDGRELLIGHATNILVFREKLRDSAIRIFVHVVYTDTQRNLDI